MSIVQYFTASKAIISRRSGYNILFFILDAVSSEDFDLKVKCVNLNIDTNTKDHRTDEYSISKERKDLIVRRGQPFDVSLEFNRKFDLKADYLKISFLIGMYFP